MAQFLLFLTFVLGIVVFVVLLRLSAFRGRIKSDTPMDTRLYRWNTYVSPHIEKYMETKILIASTGCFKVARPVLPCRFQRGVCNQQS